MEILFILIPLSIILVAIALYIFSWAVKSGQFDDLEGPGHRILYDDDADMIPVKPKPLPKESPDSGTPPTSTKP